MSAETSAMTTEANITGIWCVALCLLVPFWSLWLRQILNTEPNQTLIYCGFILVMFV